MRKKHNLKTLSVNWHILQPCNFGCNYCYAEWETTAKLPVVERDTALTNQLLTNLAAMRQLAWVRGRYTVRLNIAGGEPLLRWRKGNLRHILREAHAHGFLVSIITNGSLLTHDILEEIAPWITVLGISLDASSTELNDKMGRTAKGKKTIPIGDASRPRHAVAPTPQQVAEFFAAYRRLNPAGECKLNTVVTRCNAGDDMNAAIAVIKPDRWKIFQMLSVSGSGCDERSRKQASLAISQAEFNAYCARHAGQHAKVMQPEDNNAMTESYLMIDPHGNFFQNQPKSNNYAYSSPLTTTRAAAALEQINFDCSKYDGRQKKTHQSDSAAASYADAPTTPFLSFNGATS